MNQGSEDAAVPFEEFVTGVGNGTVKFTINGKLQSRVNGSLIKSASVAAASYALTAISKALPFVLIPLVCYLKDNWLLLLGFLPIPFAFLTSDVCKRCSRPFREFFQLTLILLFLVTVLWYGFGLFSVLTFMALCFLYEYFQSFVINFMVYDLVAKSLMNDPDHYNTAVALNRITVKRRPLHTRGIIMNQKSTCPHCMKTFEVPGELFNTTVVCPTCNGKFNPMKEYIKSGCESRKTPEFQAALKEMIAENNKNITHDDFVIGMENKTIGYKVMVGEPSQMLTGYRKFIFNILVMLYLAAPFVLIPLWAYFESNWWLLTGIVISFIATRVASRLIYNEQKQNSIGGFLLLACIVSWLVLGIHNYYTFFILCALWGFMFFMIAENAEKEYLMQLLLENPDLFNNAIDHHRIMIVRTSDL